MNYEDVVWMRRALAEAKRGKGVVEPNPMVGAVVVRDGRIVGFGHHERFGGPHAEVMAIERAGPHARGASLYVTLEPCCHHGKTPPCTAAILEAGISRVVAAMRDPFPRVDGGGLSLLRAAGVTVEVGLEHNAAQELNAPYLKRLLTGSPYVTAKWAMTLDGKTAVASGDSHWISSDRSRAMVHELRGRMDAILVGIGTAITDDPQLTVRPPGPRTPVRIVMDSKGVLPTSSRLLQTARTIPVIVAVTEHAPIERRQALTQRGCEVLVFRNTSRVPVLPLLLELGTRGMTNLLIEGGGTVLGSFLDEEQVDEVDVYVAPVLEGGNHNFTPIRGRGSQLMSDALRLEGITYSKTDGDLRIRGRLPQSWRSRRDALTLSTSP